MERRHRVDEEIVDDTDDDFWRRVRTTQLSPPLNLGRRHVERFDATNLPPMLPFRAGGECGAGDPSGTMSVEHVTFGPPDSYLRRDFFRDLVFEQLGVPDIRMEMLIKFYQIFLAVRAASRARQSMMRIPVLCTYAAFNTVVHVRHLPVRVLL